METWCHTLTSTPAYFPHVLVSGADGEKHQQHECFIKTACPLPPLPSHHFPSFHHQEGMHGCLMQQFSSRWVNNSQYDWKMIQAEKMWFVSVLMSGPSTVKPKTNNLYLLSNAKDQHKYSFTACSMTTITCWPDALIFECEKNCQ